MVASECSRTCFNNARRMAAAIITVIAVLLSGAQQLVPGAAEPPKSQDTAGRDVQLRGQVVCLAEEMHRLHQTDLPTDHPHLYGFKTNDGEFYTLLRTRYSEALFTDARLREKELLLKGRVLANSRIFDVATIRSIVGGVVHEVYYFCTICNIVSIAPGICDCCREPVEFVEKPIQ